MEPLVENLSSAFSALHGVPEFDTLRNRARTALAASGLPSSRDEEWKYTNISPLTRADFLPVQARTAARIPAEFLHALEVPGGLSARLTFVDGVFSSEHSFGLSDANLGHVGPLSSLAKDSSSPLRSLVLAQLLASTDESTDGFVALNTALLGEGAVISVPGNVTVPLPILMVSISTGQNPKTLVPLRHVISVGENAEAHVIESYLGPDDVPYFTTAVTELTCGRSSRFTHSKIQREGIAAYHIARLNALVDGHAVFNSNVYGFGGKTVRNEVCPVFRGEHIECHLFGLTALRDGQHTDNNTVLDHAKPNCFSREHYKGIYGGKSSGVFGGTIIVRPQAQKTNAIQSNQTLLLSGDATIDTRPQLKIWADDVKCTHGATIGQLDEDALFYIRSRGVSQESARSLLVHAFASEIVQHLPTETIRSWVESMLVDRLRELLGAGVELGHEVGE